MTFLPPNALEQHIAILGKTGSGKTSTGKQLVEHVAREGSRVCILDPIKSDWWGLISSADGRKPGLPFDILGGPRGHVPLHSASGRAIGEIVASGQLPLSIIDMAEFEPGGQARFFVDFAPALLRKMRGVVYLVIEEAHLFAPKERSGVGQENLSIHWAKTMATAGRSKGIRLVVLTQRTQALHNAILGSCETMLAHRLSAPADQEPIVKWLKANCPADVAREVAGSLSSLKTGEAWVCSGEAKLFERRQFPRIKTYDNTATPTGAGSDHAVKTAPIDQDKLRALIGEAVKQAAARDRLRGAPDLPKLSFGYNPGDERHARAAALVAAADVDGQVKFEPGPGSPAHSGARTAKPGIRCPIAGASPDLRAERRCQAEEEQEGLMRHGGGQVRRVQHWCWRFPPTVMRAESKGL